MYGAFHDPHSRPVMGATVLPDNGFGIVAAFAFTEDGTAPDQLSRVQLAASGSPSWSAGPLGPGLSCTSNNAVYSAVAPSFFRLALPISLGVWIRSLGTPTNSVTHFGVTYDNSNTSPFFAYTLGIDGTGHWQTGYNSAGTFGSAASTRLQTADNNVDRFLSAVLTTSSVTVYIDGLSIKSTSGISNPTYGTNPTVYFGNPSFFTARNPNALYYGGAIANVAWAPDQVFELAAKPGIIWQPTNTRRYALMSTPPVGGSGPFPWFTDTGNLSGGFQVLGAA